MADKPSVEQEDKQLQDRLQRETSLYAILSVVALAVYGFWISLRRQPLSG